MLSSFEKNFRKNYIDFAIFKFLKKLLKSHGVTSRKNWVKLWEFFGKIFLKFGNFFLKFVLQYIKQV